SCGRPSGSIEDLLPAPGLSGTAIHPPQAVEIRDVADLVSHRIRRAAEGVLPDDQKELAGGQLLTFLEDHQVGVRLVHMRSQGVSRISCQLPAVTAWRIIRLRRARSEMPPSRALTDSSAGPSLLSPTSRTSSFACCSRPSSRIIR